MDVALIPAADAAATAELDAFLDACPASVAQQTSAWRAVITSIDRDEPLFLGCRQAGRLVGVLPAYRFEGPLGAILTSVPQPGPLGGVACHPAADPEAVYAALLDGFVSLATARECALASVITSPFWPDKALYDRHLRPDYALENACQVLDLGEAFDPAGMLRVGSENLRRNLRRAQSGALAIDEAETPANVEEWYEIHAARHREIGATPLPKGLFTSALGQAVPAEKARFFFVRLADSGEMIGGGFYVHHGVVMDAFMPSVASAHAGLAPAYLLAWHSIGWARARGIRYYNWQASPPDGGVHRFKTQWGSRDLPYWYLTRVTGDATPFLESTVETVAAAYRWHYVLPFDRIGHGAARGPGRSSRRDAWQAREATKP
jgi:hypothetical protein